MSLPNHGHTPAKAAAVAGVSPVTAEKWLVRYQTEGWAGLQDRWSVSLPNRSSRPKRLRQPTPARTIKRIIALRRQRLSGRPIAQMVGVSPATVRLAHRPPLLRQAQQPRPGAETGRPVATQRPRTGLPAAGRLSPRGIRRRVPDAALPPASL